MRVPGKFSPCLAKKDNYFEKLNAILNTKQTESKTVMTVYDSSMIDKFINHHSYTSCKSMSTNKI